MAKPRISVISENSSGRNTRFHDNQTGTDMSLNVFVRQIEAGKYPDYHIRIINNVKTPASNPDSNSKNNLG